MNNHFLGLIFLLRQLLYLVIIIIPIILFSRIDNEDKVTNVESYRLNGEVKKWEILNYWETKDGEDKLISEDIYYFDENGNILSQDILNNRIHTLSRNRYKYYYEDEFLKKKDFFRLGYEYSETENGYAAKSLLSQTIYEYNRKGQVVTEKYYSTDSDNDNKPNLIYNNKYNKNGLLTNQKKNRYIEINDFSSKINIYNLPIIPYLYMRYFFAIVFKGGYLTEDITQTFYTKNNQIKKIIQRDLEIFRKTENIYHYDENNNNKLTMLESNYLGLFDENRYYHKHYIYNEKMQLFKTESYNIEMPNYKTVYQYLYNDIDQLSREIRYRLVNNIIEKKSDIDGIDYGYDYKGNKILEQEIFTFRYIHNQLESDNYSYYINIPEESFDIEKIIFKNNSNRKVYKYEYW